jgi:phosphoglycolate phosphatase-like HAD superfamily hydrolase
MDLPDSLEQIKKTQPEHDYFVGIDSDGCMFDTMEIKHKECFCPNTILHWELQPVSRYARQAAEFVNLYSKWRGINRWPGLVMVLDLLREHPEVLSRNVRIPQLNQVRAFIKSGLQLSDAGFRNFMGENPHPELERAWQWSNAVNRAIREMVHGIPPYPQAMNSLRKMAGRADLMVVSCTPVDVIAREWMEHGILEYLCAVGGQETGTKVQQLQSGTRGKYLPEHMLMVGDAPGDLHAARSNKVLFYPIFPGREDESWERFVCEAFDKFLRDEYAGEYEATLVSEFEKLLPELPPWKIK